MIVEEARHMQKAIFQGSPSYSSLRILNDQSIGLLYEWEINLI